MVKLVVCSQVKEIKDRFHIMRCISESVSSFRSQCYWSENWITSNNHTGVNIRESWPWDAFRAAIGDEKAPPATPRTWEPFEELDLTVAPTLACKPITSSPNPWITGERPSEVFLFPSNPLPLFCCPGQAALSSQWGVQLQAAPIQTCCWGACLLCSSVLLQPLPLGVPGASQMF